jgi:hypothetical protein
MNERTMVMFGKLLSGREARPHGIAESSWTTRIAGACGDSSDGAMRAARSCWHAGRCRLDRSSYPRSHVARPGRSALTAASPAMYFGGDGGPRRPPLCRSATAPRRAIDQRGRSIDWPGGFQPGWIVRRGGRSGACRDSQHPAPVSASRCVAGWSRATSCRHRTRRPRSFCCHLRPVVQRRVVQQRFMRTMAVPVASDAGRILGGYESPSFACCD